MFYVYFFLHPLSAMYTQNTVDAGGLIKGPIWIPEVRPAFWSEEGSHSF